MIGTKKNSSKLKDWSSLYDSYCEAELVRQLNKIAEGEKSGRLPNSKRLVSGWLQFIKEKRSMPSNTGKTAGKV